MSDPRSRRLAVLALGAMALAGCGGGNVPAPTSYKAYDHKDSEWKCDYPADWEVKGGGKKNHYANFTKGGAAIKVKTDLTGSIMGDLEAAANSSKQVLTEKDAPVHKVHLKFADDMNEQFSAYKEQEAVSFRATLGDGRKSEFTVGGGLGGPLHGYRATILGRDKRFQIVCTCPESNWATLKPAFDKALESFSHGPGG